MLDIISKIIVGVISPVTNLIDEMHTSDEEKLRLKNEMQKLQNQLAIEIMDFMSKQVEAQKEIIVAEIKNGWLSRSWRPILMLTIVAIVANNYLVYPYLSMFTDKAVVLTLPDKLYGLMEIGVGGYVVGRSAEKVMESFKNKGDK